MEDNAEIDADVQDGTGIGFGSDIEVNSSADDSGEDPNQEETNPASDSESVMSEAFDFGYRRDGSGDESRDSDDNDSDTGSDHDDNEGPGTELRDSDPEEDEWEDDPDETEALGFAPL